MQIGAFKSTEVALYAAGAMRSEIDGSVNSMPGILLLTGYCVVAILNAFILQLTHLVLYRSHLIDCVY